MTHSTPFLRVISKILLCVSAALIAGDALSAAGEDAATKPAENWQSLFDGKTLGKWTTSDFAGHGEPAIEEGNLVLPFGETLTGVTYSGKTPKMNYEIAIEGKKVDGADFFCGLTFPVNNSFASLICGGWGGTVVGISSLDGKDANRNETRVLRKFERNKWYKIRLRVLPSRLQAWIDGEQVIDAPTTGRTISTRVEVDASKPFGISSFQTTAAFRSIRIRSLRPDEIPATRPANR
ncbi:MAG TPA: DUF1080 domain-containing protein [Tepidisphaeraceae bacterium]|jgi:hypothetical protein|nr:DUF1080 domain-containing protein [Tepidisphaeraceae bacterium]